MSDARSSSQPGRSWGQDSQAGVGTQDGRRAPPSLCPPSTPHRLPTPSPPTVEDVVILTTPTPVLAGEAIDSQELGFIQARHTSEVASIGQLWGTEDMRLNQGLEGIPDRGLATSGWGLGGRPGQDGRLNQRREPSPEAKFVHGNGKVAGLVTTAYRLRPSAGDQVHVTEDEAVVGRVLPECL